MYAESKGQVHLGSPLTSHGGSLSPTTRSRLGLATRRRRQKNSHRAPRPGSRRVWTSPWISAGFGTRSLLFFWGRLLPGGVVFGDSAPQCNFGFSPRKEGRRARKGPGAQSQRDLGANWREGSSSAFPKLGPRGGSPAVPAVTRAVARRVIGESGGGGTEGTRQAAAVPGARPGVRRSGRRGNKCWS